MKKIRLFLAVAMSSFVLMSCVETYSNDPTDAPYPKSVSEAKALLQKMWLFESNQLQYLTAEFDSEGYVTILPNKPAPTTLGWDTDEFVYYYDFVSDFTFNEESKKFEYRFPGGDFPIVIEELTNAKLVISTQMGPQKWYAVAKSVAKPPIKGYTGPKIDKMTDESMDAYIFDYTNDKLSKVTLPDGSSLSITYSANQVRTNNSTFDLDDMGYAYKMEYSGNSYRLKYNQNGQLAAVIYRPTSGNPEIEAMSSYLNKSANYDLTLNGMSFPKFEYGTVENTYGFLPVDLYLGGILGFAQLPIAYYAGVAGNCVYEKFPNKIIEVGSVSTEIPVSFTVAAGKVTQYTTTTPISNISVTYK